MKKSTHLTKVLDNLVRVETYRIKYRKKYKTIKIQSCE